MASVEITRDLFQHHDPLAFKKHPPGRQLYWANRSWRMQKGWNRLKPVHTTDTDWDLIKECMSEAPLDLDLHGDTLVRRGDLVLCTKSEEDVAITNQRRSWLANRKVDALKKGYNPVNDELSMLSRGGDSTDYVSSTKPEFHHERGTQPPVIRTGVAKGR